jgi:HlyD family secretion protein
LKNVVEPSEIRDASCIEMSSTWKTVKRWSWRALKAIVLLSVVGGVIYWMRFAPVSVIAHSIQRDSIVAEVMGTGTLEARVAATISPKISGRIGEVLVDQGDRVSVGDVLVRLDDEELKQQVAIAQANVEAAAAAIDRLKTDKNRATAVFEQAQKSHDRVRALIEQNAVSHDDVDKSTEALAVAIVGISRAEAGIAEGQKELVSAEKTLEYHRARLQDTEIRTPFDGLIVKRSREPGDVVVPGSSMLTLISTDELWISAWVDETEMSRVRQGQVARVLFRSEPDRSYPGTVARLGREADRETREFIVDIRVLELPENWAVGQRAEAMIEVAEKADAIVLPAKLLVNRSGESGVFVNAEGVARWKPVTAGLRSRDSLEVLEGLQPGDVVVIPTDPQAALRQGQSIVTP